MKSWLSAIWQWIKANYKAVVGALLAPTFAIVGVIVGGNMSANASRQGAQTTADASLRAAGDKLKADRDSEMRERKIHAYTEFLDAVEGFVLPLVDPPKSEKPVAVPHEVQEITAPNALLGGDALGTAARIGLKSKVNQIYIYGSDEAWAAANELLRFLLESADNAAGAAKPPFDTVRYNKLFGDFRAAFCREAAAQPRPGCSP